MIIDGEKWHYLAVKNLFRLLSGITLNQNGEFYCLNSFHSYRTDNKLKKHEKVCNEKSIKVLFIIYVDLECLLQKMHSFMTNLEKSYTKKKAKHRPLDWAMTVKCSFDVTKNKYDYCRERDCIKKLCKKLKDQAMEIINYEKKKNYTVNR